MRKTMTINQVITNLYPVMKRQAGVKLYSSYRSEDNIDEVVSVVCSYILDAARQNPVKFNKMIESKQITSYIMSVLHRNCRSFSAPFLASKKSYSDRMSNSLFHEDTGEEKYPRIDESERQADDILTTAIYKNMDKIDNEACISPIEAFVIRNYIIGGCKCEDVALVLGRGRSSMFSRVRALKEDLRVYCEFIKRVDY